MAFNKLPSWATTTNRDYKSFGYGFLDDSEIYGSTYNTLFLSMFENHNYLSTSLTLHDSTTIAPVITSQVGSQIFSDSINKLSDSKTTDISVVGAKKDSNGTYLRENISPILDRSGIPITLQLSDAVGGCGLKVPSYDYDIRPPEDAVVGLLFRYYITPPRSTNRWKLIDLRLKTSITMSYPESSRLISANPQSIEDMTAKMISDVSQDSIFNGMEHNRPNTDIGEAYSVSQNIIWGAVDIPSNTIGSHIKGSPRGLPKFREDSYMYADIFVPIPTDALRRGSKSTPDIVIENISTFLGDGGATTSDTTKSPRMTNRTNPTIPRFSLDTKESLKYIPKGFGLYDTGSYSSSSETGRSSLLLTLSSLSYLPEYTPMWLFSGSADYQSFFYSNKDLDGNKKHYKVASDEYANELLRGLTTEEEVNTHGESLASRDFLLTSTVEWGTIASTFQTKRFNPITLDGAVNSEVVIYADGDSDTIESSIAPKVPSPKNVGDTEMFLLYGTSKLYVNIVSNEGLWNFPEFPKEKVYAGTVISPKTWGYQPTSRQPIIFGKGSGDSNELDNSFLSLFIKGHTTKVNDRYFSDVITLSLYPRGMGYSTDTQELPYTTKNYPKVTIAYKRAINGDVSDIRATSSSTSSGSSDYLGAVTSETDVMYNVDIPNQIKPYKLWQGMISSPGDSLMWYQGAQGDYSYEPHNPLGRDFNDFQLLRFTLVVNNRSAPNQVRVSRSTITATIPNPFKTSEPIDVTCYMTLMFGGNGLGEIPLRFRSTHTQGQPKTNNVQMLQPIFHDFFHQNAVSKPYDDMVSLTSIEGLNYSGWDKSKARACYTFTSPVQNRY